MDTERLLEAIAAREDPSRRETAPARLKSRIYSALVARLAAEGPLRELGDCQAAGGHLCVFERALIPLGTLSASNPCRVCHARVLGERLEHAPIFWPGCPYAEFHNP